jgi:hypothetical protein
MEDNPIHFPLSKRQRYLVEGFLLVIFFWSSATSSMAASINLAWDVSSGTVPAGYKLYYGTSSRGYGTSFNVGNVTTYTVAALASGTYYFAVTAYDGSGNESTFSNEVSATISATSGGCDVNGDGTSNALDLQTEINAILGSNTSATFDVNGDGMVNALDLQALGNVVLGVSSCP